MINKQKLDGSSKLAAKPDVRVLAGKVQFSPPFKLVPLRYVEDEDEDGNAPVKGMVLEDAEGVAVAYFNQTVQSLADVEIYASSWTEGYMQAREHLGAIA
jgi:hypothetical protein